MMHRTTAYLAKGSKSARAFEAALRVLPGANTRTTVFRAPYPPSMASGQGARLTDEDGESRLDFLNNYTSLIHGHSHPAIVQRVTEQLGRATAFSFPSSSERELAERLVQRLPSADSVRFTNSGSEAVMLAIRIARAATGRDRIAKFEGCYHGSYDEAMVSESPTLDALGPIEQPRSVPERGVSAGAAASVLTLPYNHPEFAIPLIERHAAELAAVIVDPAPNRAGLARGSATFMAALREITARKGIVLIFDEVITFRAGPGGLQRDLGIEPDLTTLGKIIGGGFPVGAVAGRANFMNHCDPRNPDRVEHGGTFNANPVTMTAGVAALDLLPDAEYVRLGGLAERLKDGLESALPSLGCPCRVNVVGSLFQVQLRADEVWDYRSLRADPAALERTARLSQALLARGVILAPNGLGCISTPMTAADVDEFVEATTSAVQEELAPVRSA